MRNINTFIKENISDIGSQIYVAPDIPNKKLNNAIKAFKCQDFYDSILAIYDDTLFGSAKTGLVFTGERMIHHEYGEFLYRNIKSVKYVSNDDYVLITTKDGNTYELKYNLVFIDKEKLATFLNRIITEFSEYKEENQITILSEMPSDLKLAYLKIIANMTYLDDNSIDKKELSELLLLMTRLNLDRDTRFKIRSYITNISQQNIESIDQLLDTIKSHSDHSQHKSIMISLAKDLINVYFSTKNTLERDCPFIDKYKDLFNLTDADIDLAYTAIENDHKILKYDVDDNAIQKHAKELAVKAAAAGVPLGAVYISGSVVGLSAAGITSGLAALGFGMGMTGGLAVVGVIGVLSYKTMKRLTGCNEVDKYKHKELMLHNVITQTQKTISLVIDDVNYLVRKLNDTIIKHSEQRQKIKELIQMISQYHGALKCLDEKSDSVKNIVSRIRCPKILDKDRLESLTLEPTKKQHYSFIIENYELKQIGENGGNTQKYVLKENLSTDLLDKMADSFQAIGYFDPKKTIKCKAFGLAKGLAK